MASEPTRRKLVEAVDLILSRNLEVLGIKEDGAQLGDWMVIVSAPSLDSTGEPWSGYAVLGSGNLLEHNALGLIDKAAEILSGDE